MICYNNALFNTTESPLNCNRCPNAQGRRGYSYNNDNLCKITPLIQNLTSCGAEECAKNA